MLTNDIKKTLLYKKISSLIEMDDFVLNELSSIVKEKHLLKGERILEEGQVCKAIFFIERGYMRVFMNKDGIEISTAFVFENNFVSNLKSINLSLPSDTSIEAGEDAIIYQFNKADHLKLYTKSPEIESFGRKILEELLITQEEHANLFKIFSPKERYRYLETNYPHIIQRVSLTQIASYLGIARETLSRMRSNKS